VTNDVAARHGFPPHLAHLAEALERPRPHGAAAPDPVALRIGVEIRRWRRLRGHSVCGLARAVGVSHSTVSRWESGERRPTLPHLIALGRVFGAGARTLIPE